MLLFDDGVNLRLEVPQGHTPIHTIGTALVIQVRNLVPDPLQTFLGALGVDVILFVRHALLPHFVVVAALVAVYGPAVRATLVLELVIVDGGGLPQSVGLLPDQSQSLVLELWKYTLDIRHACQRQAS